MCLKLCPISVYFYPRDGFLVPFFPLEFMIAFVFLLFLLPAQAMSFRNTLSVFILFYFIDLVKHPMRCDCQNNQDLKYSLLGLWQLVASPSWTPGNIRTFLFLRQTSRSRLLIWHNKSMLHFLKKRSKLFQTGYIISFDKCVKFPSLNW